MRRSIVLATVIAASTAVFGAACSGTPAENKPENKPVVTSTATPAPSPSATTPVNTNVNGVKPVTNTSPEVKKVETNGNKTEVKPMVNANATPHK